MVMLNWMFASVVLAATAGPAAPDWQNEFYQYRFPMQVNADVADWSVVPVSPEVITQLVNQCEELAFDSRWFAHNFLKVVDLTDDSFGRGAQAEAGFYLIPVGKELVPLGTVGKQESVEVPTEKGKLYLVQYVSDGAGHAPGFNYEPIFPIGTALRTHECYVSHEPRMLPLHESSREQLIQSDGSKLKFDLAGRFVKGIRSFSVKQVEILFLAKVPAAGEREWMVYYQPTTGHNLTIPKRRHEEVPKQVVVPTLPNKASKFWGNTAYRLPEAPSLQPWFAETTRKISPRTPTPPAQADGIEVSAAANESQSFQLVLSPKKRTTVDRISATDLVTECGTIAREDISIRRAEYVPIRESSYITPVKYVGQLADPLVPLKPEVLDPEDGNVPYWITIRARDNVKPGKYRGQIELEIAGEPTVKIPLCLEVFDFALPEFSPFRTSFGGAHIAKATFEGEKTVADYHAVTDKAGIKKLAREYYDAMAVNKATPHNVTQFSEIGMNWSPPPEGLNVDKEGNYFELKDWDFTELNADLHHYIDELKVNGFAIIHTNPSDAMVFRHLPGKEHEAYDRFPPHVTLAWQAFRAITPVGYNKVDSDDFQEITQQQYDQLVLDFHVAVAENLEKHGWLDYAYIMVDESVNRGYEPLLHQMKLLKQHPLTARIKFLWALQVPGAFNHKESPDAKDYAFHKLLDIYCPETNENCHFWEPYYFSDYGISPERQKLWNYVTYTTRTVIDTPGINNRTIALEVFNNGGGGFLNWASCIWDSPEHAETRGSNPWQDPFARWGNGTISYFYPPGRTGPVESPDYTVTPSLRLETYRESVDDFEYAWLLENLIKQGREEGVDVEKEVALLAELKDYFPSATIWSQNDAWYLAYRDRLARAIVDLKQRVDAKEVTGTARN